MTVILDLATHSLSVATKVRFTTQNKFSSHLFLAFIVKDAYELFLESMLA